MAIVSALRACLTFLTLHNFSLGYLAVRVCVYGNDNKIDESL